MLVPYYTEPKTGVKYDLKAFDFNSEESADVSLDAIKSNSRHVGVIVPYSVGDVKKYATYVGRTSGKK